MSNISRVAASAQLNIKGSAPQRVAIAMQKRDDFVREALPMMKNDGGVMRSVLYCLFGHHAPGVDFSVGRTLSPKEYSGCVDFKYAQNKIQGLSLELPFDDKLILQESYNNKNTLVHEATHFFEMLATPKIAARDAALGSRRFNPKFVARQEQYDNFYDEKLYNDSFNFHHKEGHSKFESKKKLLKYQIEVLFAKLKTPSDEKIDVLQEYRNNLKLEYNARKSEACTAETQEEKSRHEKSLHGYFYQPKIHIVEELLREEISSHRKAHAQSLKKTN